MRIKRQLQRTAKKLGIRVFKASALPRGFDISADIDSLIESPVQTVFDVGANTGQTAQHFHDSFPQAAIYAFEPVKDTFETLARNMRSLSRVSCLNHALGSFEREEIIYLQLSSGWNSLSRNIDQGLGSELVKVETIDNFCKKSGIETIDVLKIDTEGHDLEVIKGADETLKNGRTSFIFCEVGFSRDAPKLIFFCDFLDYLDSKGFQLFSLYDTRTLFYIPHSEPRYSYCNALFVNTQLVITRMGPAYERRVALRREERRDLLKDSNAPE